MINYWWHRADIIEKEKNISINTRVLDSNLSTEQYHHKVQVDQYIVQILVISLYIIRVPLNSRIGKPCINCRSDE